ncbi:MAG: hypothetical protein ABGY95_11015 [Rubritalea sp.]|uniref:hypothetical protein n=1 Tax=Rubritalea sp. TaxID=2109375 RepID=UPI0032422DA1
MNVSELDPAERDPKAIRRTVIILCLMMAVGGPAIIWAYFQKDAKDRQEILDGRSPRISHLTKNFAGICQDGESRGLDDLEGKVWVVAPIVPNHAEENKIQLAKMQELAERYKGREDFHLVCLSVADPTKHGYEELAKIADEVGADIKQWWFMAAGEEKMIGYLKDHLKMAHINERKAEDAKKFGKYDVPAQLRVVDQSRRVRGEHQQFDFDFAAVRQSEAREQVRKNPNLLEDKDSYDGKLRGFYYDMDNIWTKRMHKVIDYTFNEDEADKDPDYNKAIFVVLLIVAFIAFQVIRLRKRANG